MKSSTIPEQRCQCGYVCELANNTVDERGPRAGDVALCWGCGKIEMFTEELTLRAPTREERLKISANPIITAAQIYIRGR